MANIQTEREEVNTRKNGKNYMLLKYRHINLYISH